MSSTLIRIPSERAEQLRLLADHHKQTVADLIGDLVKAEIQRLDLVSKIGLGRDIDVGTLEHGRVYISAQGIGNLDWESNTARGLADALERAADGRAITLDMDAGLELRRVGTSVKVKNIGTGEERTLAPSIANELAALLRNAASATI